MSSSPFSRHPIRSLQIMLRSIAKADNQPCAIIPDGVYDQETTRTVSRFQQNHGLPITGVTDATTWDAIVNCYEKAQVNVSPPQTIHICLDCGQSLQPGCTSCYIVLVQAMLSLLSETCCNIPTPGFTGINDETCSESIRCFQQLCGLPCSGSVDKTTWKHLVLQYELAANR